MFKQTNAGRGIWQWGPSKLVPYFNSRQRANTEPVTPSVGEWELRGKDRARAEVVYLGERGTIKGIVGFGSVTESHCLYGLLFKVTRV